MSGQSGAASAQHTYVPPEGYLPDEPTALLFARAVLAPVLEDAETDQPVTFAAHLSDDMWVVTAELVSTDRSYVVEIAKADGRIEEMLAPTNAGGMRAPVVPSAGFIPDTTTASSAAEAVLSAVYGADQIGGQKPFLVSENDGVWIVRGQLPENMLGGVALLEISRADGRILRMTHGR